MKNIFILIFSSFLFSCNYSASKKDKGNLVDDTLSVINSNRIDNTYNKQEAAHTSNNSPKETDTVISRKVDTVLLMNISTEILKSIKTRNYKKFASFIHPQDGIRFSPYAFIGTTDIKFSASEVLLIAKQHIVINWHSSWEDTAELKTIDQYFKKFVYDVDFLNAELKSVNKFHSQGTDLNNITEAYPGCDVVEFFFSGFKKEYEGMDYRALRLVFKMQNKHPYLIAIVHDEWTP